MATSPQPRARIAVALLLAAPAWLWLLLALPSFTDAACDFEMGLILLGSGLLLAFAWTLATPFLWGSLGSRAGKAWWLSVPLAGLIGLLLAFTDRDLALRVALSESKLLDHGADVASGTNDGRTESWVGLFRVRETQAYDGIVLYYTRQSFLNREGVAHIPPGRGPPPRIGVSHLYGNWYRFTWRF